MIFPATPQGFPFDAAGWLGQTLAAENFDPGGGVAVYASTVYTPWSASNGEVANFAMDVLGISPAGTNTDPRLRLIVQTKKLDELDASASDLATIVATSTGLHQGTATGIKQLVRMKFVLDDTAGSPIARVYCACFRVLAPQWQTQ